MRANESATFCDVVVDEINVWFYIVVGIITVIFMFVFFVRRSKGESYNVMLADFLAIKDNEVQTKIGMCWKDGESVMEKDNEIRINAMMDGYLKEIGKYL
jgi:hypothetical protein